ncbi:hypothetical protein [Candidatus Mesenet endosymbiont of Agriotes lineatus]|uniref:hypothetical protein n=1 Tax=Candidatus Mesenet endosymbiont of Agriotes lineatus TaxID=3077948 RepID=UPI0030D5C843
MEGGYNAGKKINLVIAVKITPLYFRLKKKLQKGCTGKLQVNRITITKKMLDTEFQVISKRWIVETPILGEIALLQKTISFFI